jgi:hypothetical protein
MVSKNIFIACLVSIMFIHLADATAQTKTTPVPKAKVPVASVPIAKK